MDTFITLRGVHHLAVKFLPKYFLKFFYIICIISGFVVCLKINFEIFLADVLAEIQLRGLASQKGTMPPHIFSNIFSFCSSYLVMIQVSNIILKKFWQKCQQIFLRGVSLMDGGRVPKFLKNIFIQHEFQSSSCEHKITYLKFFFGRRLPIYWHFSETHILYLTLAIKASTDVQQRSLTLTLSLTQSV